MTAAADRPSGSDQVSKALVVSVAGAAVALEALISVREWHLMWPLACAAFGLSALCVRRFGAYGAWPALVLTFIYPALFLAMRGNGRIVYSVVWFAAMLGVVVSGRGWRGWSIPGPWRLPLVYWALVVAISCPLIIAREMSFDWRLLDRYDTASSRAGGPAPLIAVWVCNVTLLNLVGVLFFDWCFRMVASGGVPRFLRAVVAPLSISGILGCALAIYQGAVDVGFLSGHQWPLHNRAAGGLLDGDAFGALAGFWSAASVALAASGGPLGALGLASVGAHWAGLWASGSRMALVAGLVGGLGVLAGVVGFWGRATARVRAGAILAVAMILLIPMAAAFSTANPLERTLRSLPEFSRPALTRFAHDYLWNRGAPYGTASIQMIERYPFSGVGVSSYLTLFPDYAYTIDRIPDAMQENAQSWYRQQLAELGVLGSLGWLVFLALCAVLVVRSFHPKHGLAGAALAAALTAVAVVSAISLPTQHPAVAFSVWVFVAWLVVLTGGLRENAVTRRLQPTRARWAAVWVAVGVFALATMVTGAGSLSLPQRAAAADWDYQYGFYAAEVTPDGQQFRWTRGTAVDVVATRAPWLRLVIGGGPTDLGERPQRLRVRRNGKVVIDYERRTQDAEVWYIGVPSVGQRMIISIDVDRVWSPPGETRTFGVAVSQWEHPAAPPPGARIVR